ncbi:LPXTG cell wall anchor domain-containing protein [Staphylococcus haemolyticus]|uniref:LPXTG cell wall anchor domain-containing protein n=1 Tax=Staphylococcus haemolyticus TaxID=1283 RepID=UPI0015D8DA84|nr:LPXTG cell wall anchor domain-containing protein [Staphylococcus haemolyticus]
MKKASILATTTLAGTLLFVGAGHAQAASQISSQQAENEVASYIQSSNNYHKMPESGVNAISSQESFSPIKNAYAVAFGQVDDNGPTFLYVNKSTGTIYDGHGNVLQQGTLGQTTSNANHQQNGENSQTTANNQNSQNTSQQSNANAQSSQDNITTKNTTNQTTSTKALPETGETSNSGLLTTIAAVLLAAGSFLALRRTSTIK